MINYKKLSIIILCILTISLISFIIYKYIEKYTPLTNLYALNLLTTYKNSSNDFTESASFINSIPELNKSYLYSDFQYNAKIAPTQADNTFNSLKNTLIGGSPGFLVDKNSTPYNYVVCPAGFACNNNIKTQCTGTTYADTGFSSCLPCPQGFTCSNGIKS
jgi:hypothetical protein